MILTPLRGGAELGPVALRVESEDRTVLLDCGTGSRGGASWTNEVDDLDAVWVGHAHRDHCGGLSELWTGRPRLDAVATPATARLTEYVLQTLPDCDPRRAADLRAGFRTVSPGSEFEFVVSRTPERGSLRGRVLSAGHLLGAAMLWMRADRSSGGLLYTGDFCLHDQPVVAGANLGAIEEVEVETLVMEGVLATDEEADGSEYGTEFREFVEWCATAEGPVLVAAQASGEAVELAAGLADGGVEVAVHESLQGVVETYRAAASAPEFPVEAESALSKRLLDGGVAVAPSDQYERGTPSNRLAARVLERPEARLAVTNRAFESTPAGTVLEAESGDALPAFETRPTKRADARRFVLPAHAPRRQLRRLVEAASPERIVLVHGRESRLYSLRRHLRESGFDGSIAVPENGERSPDPGG